MKPSGPGLLFAGRFLITVSISVLVMGLLRFSISPGSVLENCTFLRICPFLPLCPFYWHIIAAAAAAKSLQSCPILCDPIDGSPPGSPIPEILQARILEWVAISFSNA